MDEPTLHVRSAHGATGLNQDGMAPFPIPSSLAARLPQDLRGANYEEIISAVAALPESERTELLRSVTPHLSDVGTMSDIDSRVVVVRFLVSLLPASLETIALALRRHAAALDYEVHFTLFCYLDWASATETMAGVAPAVLSLVAEYLHHVRADTARAAWMAGDMLGDHWSPLNDAAPVLMDAALDARFVAGRSAALYGLEQALGRLAAGGSMRAEVLSVLRRVRANDRSRLLRRSAERLLDGADEMGSEP